MNYDIIIVGGGTAGLSAAVYGSRAGKRVLILAGRQPGGQIVNSPEVENYPGIQKISGFGFVKALQEQALRLGAEVKNVQVERIKQETFGMTVETGQEKYSCQSIILAAGVVQRKLGLEKEQELTGKGVSYCAVCDGAFYRGKDVAVIGGGNTALEDAVFLSQYCRRVYVVHRRDQFRGEARLVNLLAGKENVQFIMESTVTALQGDEKLESIFIKNQVTKVVHEREVSGIFIAVGQIPCNEPFADVVQVDESGYVLADETCQTTQPGIFAAGDCRTKKVRQLVTAAADGAVAALGACEFVSGETVKA